mmetsp:Transcript_4544/g.13427  ORF Transcript_4544/g.13427 Transcript_4544/m.13427 type:complete len:182 (+) Transcript_4544:608-1153(+)
MNLGTTLTNSERFDEALVIIEEVVASSRRLYGPNDGRTILAEEQVAMALLRPGGTQNLRRAHEILTRVYSLKADCLGGDDLETLDTAGNLAFAQNMLGMDSEAVLLQRRALAGLRRALGETHLRTFEAHLQLAQTLARTTTGVNEAREIVDRVHPVARRVLGPEHGVTRGFRNLRVFRLLG